MATIVPQQLDLMHAELAGIRPVPGGINAPQGFKATGAHVGIKKRKKDLCLIVSDTPAEVASVVTTNVVKAAPILWCQQILKQQRAIKGIVVNSGNANACTGAVGMQHTEQMAIKTAEAIGCDPMEVMVASTGVIGVPMPIDTILAGIDQIAPNLDSDSAAGLDAAEAILTTDTVTKEFAVQIELSGKTVTIGGMSKGSGMIHPNMATMLAFVNTDAAITQEMLQKALKNSVDDSYHMISVDGDTSTNDMVAVLANGMAKNDLIDTENDDYIQFCKALTLINKILAQAIARDGEGATKFLTVQLTGASDKETAQKLVKSIVSSSLVKTAFYGEDANWGRILAAMGYAGVQFDPEHVDLSLKSEGGEIAMLEDGQPVVFDEDEALRVLQPKNIEILIALKEGSAEAIGWGCDLSNGYIQINSSYRT